MLDEQLLEQATHVLGVKTYSAAVNLALQETIQLKKIQALPRFFGQNLWKGDLAEMREDAPKTRRRRGTVKRARDDSR